MSYFICKTIIRITFKIHIFSEYILGDRFRTNTLNQNYIESGPVVVCAVLNHSVMSDSLQPHRLWLAKFLYPWRFFRQEYWSGLPCLLPGDLPNPGIKPRSPALQRDSLSSEPPGKPKNTGVGSLCLLQGIFLNQESNGGLRHCRLILYQLSYQGSPCSSRLSRNNLRKRKKSRKIKI